MASLVGDTKKKFFLARHLMLNITTKIIDIFDDISY